MFQDPGQGARTCPYCGAQSPSFAGYCLSCGRAHDAADSSSPTTEAQPIESQTPLPPSALEVPPAGDSAPQPPSVFDGPPAGDSAPQPPGWGQAPPTGWGQPQPPARGQPQSPWGQPQPPAWGQPQAPWGQPQQPAWGQQPGFGQTPPRAGGNRTPLIIALALIGIALILVAGLLLIVAAASGPSTAGNATPTSRIVVGSSGGPSAAAHASAHAAVSFAPFSAGTFSVTGSMAQARYAHAATLLADGRVLVTGGGDALNNPLTSAEVYDPATNAFIPAGAMGVGRISHTATLLNDGRVLLAGGHDEATEYTSAELYSPGK